jgi:hypothetical protein
MEEIDWGNRPLGVSVLAVLALAGAVIAIVAGGFVASGLSTPTLIAYPYSALTGLLAVVCGILIVVMGIVYVVAGWGMWQGKRWAWTLGVITYGFAVVSSLSEVFFGVWSGVVSLVVSLYILWYWWRPHVKAYFGKVEKRPGFGAN